MATRFANRRPRLDTDGVARWLDDMAAGPILLALTVVALVATIVRLG